MLRSIARPVATDGSVHGRHVCMHDSPTRGSDRRRRRRRTPVGRRRRLVDYLWPGGRLSRAPASATCTCWWWPFVTSTCTMHISIWPATTATRIYVAWPRPGLLSIHKHIGITYHNNHTGDGNSISAGAASGKNNMLTSSHSKLIVPLWLFLYIIFFVIRLAISMSSKRKKKATSMSIYLENLYLFLLYSIFCYTFSYVHV